MSGLMSVEPSSVPLPLLELEEFTQAGLGKERTRKQDLNAKNTEVHIT